MTSSLDFRAPVDSTLTEMEFYSIRKRNDYLGNTRKKLAIMSCEIAQSRLKNLFFLFVLNVYQMILRYSKYQTYKWNDPWLFPIQREEPSPRVSAHSDCTCRGERPSQPHSLRLNYWLHQNTKIQFIPFLCLISMTPLLNVFFSRCAFSPATSFRRVITGRSLNVHEFLRINVLKIISTLKEGWKNE